MTQPVYPVNVRLSNEQWNWLCDCIGQPQKAWRYNFGSVKFFSEQDRMWWILRWGADED